MYKQILLTHLKLKIDELSKRHLVDKDKIKITYEDYQLFYYIERGNEIEKRFLDI